MTLELEQLQERLAQLQRKVFAPSTEKRPRPAAPGHARGKRAKRGHGPREQPSLPIVDRKHELAGTDARCCPACAGVLDEMSGGIGRLRGDLRRRTAICDCAPRAAEYRCQCNGAVVTAPMPPRLIPGGRYALKLPSTSRWRSTSTICRSSVRYASCDARD